MDSDKEKEMNKEEFYYSTTDYDDDMESTYDDKYGDKDKEKYMMSFSVYFFIFIFNLGINYFIYI